ncbi:DUF1289 domain-containing protein [Allorhizobium undicola]|uniref:DUF1289 domain-containing protein n=1 Tax=Allorhizobium undicola TaxID=78527 RepID=UPI000484BB94|nr:DUF1289 domain-containing protein [Allorhizobium undicola]
MPVSSPCIGICRIDPKAGLCEGCARSLAEIAAWSSLSESERRQIMALLAGRSASTREAGR